MRFKQVLGRLRFNCMTIFHAVTTFEHKHLCSIAHMHVLCTCLQKKAWATSSVFKYLKVVAKNKQ